MYSTAPVPPSAKKNSGRRLQANNTRREMAENLPIQAAAPSRTTAPPSGSSSPPTPLPPTDPTHRCHRYPTTPSRPWACRARPVRVLPVARHVRLPPAGPRGRPPPRRQGRAPRCGPGGMEAPPRARAALLPTRSRLSAVGGSATAACSFDSGFKDSFARLLLQCDDLQTGLASMLLRAPRRAAGRARGPPAAGGGGELSTSSRMPLPKLILSQFRWLEHVADGAALLAKLGEMLEVCDAPLKRELILALPDLVQDGEHGAAVELLSGLLREESQLTATVLETLSSLQLDEDAEADVCDLVVQAVASAAAEDLPAIVRFLLAHVSSHNVDVVAAALRGGLSREMLDGHAAEGGGARAAAAAAARPTRRSSSRRFLASLRRARCLAPSSSATSRASSGRRSTGRWIGSSSRSAPPPTRAEQGARVEAPRRQGRQAQPHAGPPPRGHRGPRPALRPHLPLQISLAAGLLRARAGRPDGSRALGASLYATLFAEFAERTSGRTSSGSSSPTQARAPPPRSTPRSAPCSSTLATRDARAVSQFSPFLTGVLDYLDALTVPQARLAFELFARISYDADGGSSRLADELQITIRKQLLPPRRRASRRSASSAAAASSAAWAPR